MITHIISAFQTLLIIWRVAVHCSGLYQGVVVEIIWLTGEQQKEVLTLKSVAEEQHPDHNQSWKVLFNLFGHKKLGTGLSSAENTIVMDGGRNYQNRLKLFQLHPSARRWKKRSAAACCLPGRAKEIFKLKLFTKKKDVDTNTGTWSNEPLRQDPPDQITTCLLTLFNAIDGHRHKIGPANRLEEKERVMTRSPVVFSSKSNLLDIEHLQRSSWLGVGHCTHRARAGGRRLASTVTASLQVRSMTDPGVQRASYDGGVGIKGEDHCVRSWCSWGWHGDGNLVLGPRDIVLAVRTWSWSSRAWAGSGGTWDSAHGVVRGSFCAETEELGWIWVAIAGVSTLISKQMLWRDSNNEWRNVLLANIKEGCLAIVQGVGSYQIIISRHFFGLTTALASHSNSQGYQQQHNVAHKQGHGVFTLQVSN